MNCLINSNRCQKITVLWQMVQNLSCAKLCAVVCVTPCRINNLLKMQSQHEYPNCFNTNTSQLTGHTIKIFTLASA